MKFSLSRKFLARYGLLTSCEMLELSADFIHTRPRSVVTMVSEHARKQQSQQQYINDREITDLQNYIGANISKLAQFANDGN